MPVYFFRSSFKPWYLFTVAFFCSNCFSISLFSERTRKWAFISGLILCLLPYLYRKYHSSYLHRMNFKASIFLIISSFFLSSFTAYFDWNQPIIATLIVQRFILAFPLFYLLLHFLNITSHEIKYFFKIVACFSVALLLIQTVMPVTSVFDFGSVEKGTNFLEDTFPIFFSSLQLCLLPFYLCLYSYKKTPSNKALYWMIILLGCYFLGQNRSTLFPLACFFLIVFLMHLKSKKGIIATIIITIITGIALFYIKNIIFSLGDETVTQLNNPDYIRFKSLDFFIFEFSKSPLGSLFGNGFSSNKYAFGNYVDYLKVFKGYYQSDIGLVGDYSMYGIPFIFAIFLTVITMLKINKWQSMSMFWIFHLAVFTIFTFNSGQTCILVACLCYVTDLKANSGVDLTMNLQGNYLKW